MTVLLFLVPIIAWLAFAKFWLHHEFSGKELLAQTVFSIVLMGALFAISSSLQLGGTKLVNGEVTALRPVKKSCPIGWVTMTDSHCTHYWTRTVKIGESCSVDKNGYKSCTDITQTQYNYIYPWERRYFVDSDIPKTFEIDRVDRQGVNTPPRFAQIKISDPVTAKQSYTNYVRAAKDSLFQNAEMEPLTVAYPKVFDYYRADRVIYDGVTADARTVAAWNQSLAELNRDVRKSGANVIVVLTRQPKDYAEQLAYTWEGHNINDVVVTIGVDETGTNVAWADVRSWSQQSLVNIEIQDAVMNAKSVVPDVINTAIKTAVMENYRQQDPEAFAYLQDDISLPTPTIVLALLLIFVITPLLTWVFATRVDLK